MRRSPRRQLLVLSANLKSAWPGDIVDSELINFARRIPKVVPFAPDAVLLQEVVQSSAARVAQLLRRETGFGFEVVVSPGPHPVVGAQGNQIVVRDTAILLNRRTMSIKDDGGYLPTQYLLRDAAPQIEPRIKQHAYCLAETASSSLRLALTSVHFVLNDRLAARTMGFCYKSKWARQVANFIDKRYPQRSVTQLWVIGGDFNNRRCVNRRERVVCDVWPFWHVLASQIGYLDTVFDRHGSSNESLARQTRDGKRIDYIFARAAVLRASHDVRYDAHPGDPGFYSDHRLLWALLGPTS